MRKPSVSSVRRDSHWSVADCSPPVVQACWPSRNSKMSAAAAEVRQLPSVLAPVARDSVKFLVIGDSGTGDRAQSRNRRSRCGRRIRRVPVRVRDHARRQHVRLRASAGLCRASSSVPFKPLARREDRVSRLARQSRRSEPDVLQERSAWAGKRYLLPSTKKDVTLLRPRQQLHGQGPAALAGAGAVAVRSRSGRSPISTIRSTRRARQARLGSRLARHRRAAVHQVQRSTWCLPAHEHFYERLKPQKGIHLHHRRRLGQDPQPATSSSNTGLTAKGFDTEQSFMVVEIDGDVLRFQTISRRGKRIDSGEIRRGPTS